MLAKLLEKDKVHHLNNKDKLKNMMNDAKILRLPEAMTRELATIFEAV